MKIILFGTGDYYHKFKDWFYDEDIVCLLDNSIQKQSLLIDGKKVLAPKEGVKLCYDKICIMSVYYKEIKSQLLEMGVANEDIVHCSELNQHPEMLRTDRNAKFIDGNGNDIEKIEGASQAFLLMSHDLDFNGATLALYYAACILTDNGYDVWFASWTDGKLRPMLTEKGIGIIIDPTLQIEVFSKTDWLEPFRYIFCNTLLYYKLLSDRDYSKKYLWWLHEPELFYESVDKNILQSVRTDNLRVYAVGQIAQKAFNEMCPDVRVENLLYGIPDIALQDNSSQNSNSKVELITVGNVQEYKGQDVLINAIKQLPGEYRNKLHVTIIGGKSSAYFNSVKKAALEINNMVDFVPPVSRDAVYQYYEKADVYVCSSRQDCMPVVVAESMMFSLPSIVSDATGIAPYIQAGAGSVFHSEDSLELARAIEWYIDNQDKMQSIGRCARKQYEQFFSLKSFEENIKKIVKEHFKKQQG